MKHCRQVRQDGMKMRTVVDDLEDEDLEVSLDEAREINENYQVGDIIETEADVDHIGRLAAIQTKQLFRQKMVKQLEQHLLMVLNLQLVLHTRKMQMVLVPIKIIMQ